MSTIPIQDSNASALIIGLGGLGCPVAELLAQSGVGHVGLCDPDIVDISNLPRQTLYDEGDVGLLKVAVVAEKLMSRFSCKATCHESFVLDQDERLMREYDVTVECSDQVELKFAVSDAAVRLQRPAVIGGVIGLTGFALAIHNEGPCLRCIFEAPTDDMRRSCRDAGVLGPLPSVVGSIMAAQALGAVSKGLWSIDLNSGRARLHEWSRRPDCPACGVNSSC